MACKKKKQNTKTNMLGLLALILAIIFASETYALNNLMALQGTVNYGATPVNGNLTVTIWTQSTGGTLIYDSSNDYANSIVNGSFDVVLGDGSNELNLEYGQYYYMDMAVNGQDLDFNGADRKIFQASTGTISGQYIAGGTINSTQIADGSLTNSKISATANIAKSKIDTVNAWLESEIPSLTNTWSGTIHASKIVYQNLLNVNSSLYLGGYGASTFFSNDSALSLRINNLEIETASLNDSIHALNISKAAVGTCASGQAIQNATGSGVECVALNFGNGTITQVTAGNGLSGGVITSTGTISLNTTYTDQRYLNISDQRYNETTAINSVQTSVAGNATSLTNIGNSLGTTNTTVNNIYTNITNAQTAITNLQSANVSANTRIDSVNTTAVNAQPKSTLVTAVGNWTADKTSYNTTAQLNTLYYAISNPNNFLNSSSVTITGYYTNITNLQSFQSAIYTNTTNIGNSLGTTNTTVNNIYTNVTNLQNSQSGTYTNVTNAQTAITNLQTANVTANSRIDNANATAVSKASPGNCPAGQVVQNTTTAGVQCVIPNTPAGGSNLSVQFNLNGNITGATYADISPEGYLNTGATDTVPTPPSSGIIIAGNIRGDEIALMYESSNGYEKVVQPNIGEEDSIWCNPAHAAVGATVHTCTAGYVAAIGTVSNPATSYGNVRDSMAWNVLTSAAGLTEHKALGLKWGRGNASLTAQNGGFKLMETYYVGGYDANTVGCFGMVDEVSAYTNATNCFLGAGNKNGIFVGFDKGQTTLRIYAANATSTVPLQILDCGANYSIATATNVYRQTIYSRANSGNISIFVQRVDDTTIPPCQYIFSGTDARLPVSTIPLGWRMFMGRSGANAGTTGVIMGMNKVYISSDN